MKALFQRRGAWQGLAMATQRSPAAGGAPIALGAIAGAVVGFIEREPTLWFLGGLGTGIAVALLIWWRGR